MSIIVNNRTQNFLTNYVGKYINSPEQRLIQGITAMSIQPFVDYNNKKADDETRAVSVSRTIGKIVAGTLVGVAVRYATIYATKQFSRYTIKEVLNKDGFDLVKKVIPKSSKDIFMPIVNYKKPSMTIEQFEEKYNNYIKAMGTVVACFAMIFTNFAFDAPLTKWITKKLTPIMRNKIANQQTSEAKNE